MAKKGTSSEGFMSYRFAPFFLTLFLLFVGVTAVNAQRQPGGGNPGQPPSGGSSQRSVTIASVQPASDLPIGHQVT